MSEEPTQPFILVDCVITRRKRFHFLRHPIGASIYKSRLFGEVVEAARAVGLSEVELRDGDDGANEALLGTLKLKD